MSEILFFDFKSHCSSVLTVRTFHLVLVSWAASEHSVHVLSGQKEFGLLLSGTLAFPLAPLLAAWELREKQRRQ